MINFIESTYGDSASIGQTKFFIESLCHYGSLKACDQETFNVVKNKINLYLGSQERRYEGLILLKTAADECPVDVLQSNILIWVQSILKVLQHNGESLRNRRLAYRTLRKLLQCVLTYPHLKREASASLLPAVLDVLLESSIDDEWIDDSVKCLSTFIKFFPGTCGLKKDKIEEFLILLLDRWELKEFEPIEECFAYLPACGVDGNDRCSSYQKMWAEQFQQFLGVLNEILNFLYDGVENGRGDLMICSAKQLPPVPEEPIPKVLKLMHRFKSFGHCLAKMLVSTSQYRVAVPTDTLLKLLGRILSVSPSHMDRNTLIHSAMPSLYLTAMTVLESFILSCDQHIMGVCDPISRLLIQTVKCSSLKNSNSKDFLGLVRCAAYQAFQLYAEKFKVFSIPESHKELLVAVMISDATPCVTEFDGLTNPLIACHAVEASDSRKYRNYHRTSTEAVNALNSFMTYGNVDDKNFEAIYTCVTNSILEVQDKPFGLQYPHHVEGYRLALYSVLQTCLLNFSTNYDVWPQTVDLATSGLEDLSAVVRNKCQEILNMADIFVNTDKGRIPGLPSMKGNCDRQMTLGGEQAYNQIMASDNVFPVTCQVVNSEQHSTVNETSSCTEMVNGVFPDTSVCETPPSQTMDNNKSFHSEHSQEPHRTDSTDVTAHGEDNDIGEHVLYNSNASSASEPEDEDMDVGEEEEDNKEEPLVNGNDLTSEEGFSEEEEEEEEEEELYHNKRLFVSDVQSNGPSPKKEINLNDDEESSDPDISMMLQDFNPASPDAACM